MSKRKMWTAAETAELEFLWASLPTAAALAAHFGRSKASVRTKAKRLGLPCRPPGGTEVINSQRDPRVVEKVELFLDAYADLRNEGKACTRSGLNIQTYYKLRQRDTTFARRVALVEVQLQATLKCTVCSRVDHPGEFRPVVNKTRRTAVCNSCMNKRQRAYVNTLRGRLGRIVINAKKHQKEQGHSMTTFDLTLDYLEHMYKTQNGRCYYTGRSLVYDTDLHGALAFVLISLDRKDPKLRYTKQNVVLCCWGINNIKGTAPHDQFIATCRRIAEIHPCG